MSAKWWRGQLSWQTDCVWPASANLSKNIAASTLGWAEILQSALSYQYRLGLWGLQSRHRSWQNQSWNQFGTDLNSFLTISGGVSAIPEGEDHGEGVQQEVEGCRRAEKDHHCLLMCIVLARFLHTHSSGRHFHHLLKVHLAPWRELARYGHALLAIAPSIKEMIITAAGSTLMASRLFD